MYRISILLLFFAVAGFAQVNQMDTEGRRHGLWQGKFEESGRVRYEGTFDHGRETGVFTYYDDTKAHPVIATRDFTKGPDAVWAVFYDQQKNIVSQGALQNKKPSGKWVYYHKASKDTMTVEHYMEGTLDGVRTTYYRNGQIAEQEHYKNGKLHGSYKKYSEKGDVMEEVNYVNGLTEGPAVYRDGAGKIVTRGNYKGGKKDGLWEVYRDGKFLKKEKHPQVRKFAKRPAKKP